jgi:hypothetical protein
MSRSVEGNHTLPHKDLGFVQYESQDASNLLQQLLSGTLPPVFSFDQSLGLVSLQSRP